MKLKPNFLIFSILIFLAFVSTFPVFLEYFWNIPTNSSIVDPFKVFALLLIIGPCLILQMFGVNLLHGDFIPGPTPLGYVFTFLFYYVIAVLISLLVKEENKIKVGKVILTASVLYAVIYLVLACFL